MSIMVGSIGVMVDDGDKFSTMMDNAGRRDGGGNRRNGDGRGVGVLLIMPIDGNVGVDVVGGGGRTVVRSVVSV